VPFHIELHASGLRSAHAFNLSEGELREQVLGRWARGDLVSLGDRTWDPAKCRLTVLEGPRLDPADLSYGQGWNNARKRARDVTASVLAARSPPSPAVAPATGDAVAVLGASAPMHAFLEALGLRPVAWELVRAELIALASVAGPAGPGTLGATAAVVVLGAADGPSPLDLGLALGALGGRAVVTRVGDAEEPPELAGLSVLRLDAGGAAPLHALAQRLRAAGCALAPADGWDAPDRFRR
jgi:hypothetical protein